MECESKLSSSSRQFGKYEVFLSFRSEDTGNKFTGHLFAALKRRGIITFFPHNNSDTISSPQILKAIHESQISVVVLSTNYAASTRCLEELANIVEWRQLQRKLVFPIFYDVEPSDVRHQRGVFQQAFAEHEETFKHNLEKVERWRKSMTQVANLSGWHMQNKEPETKVIDHIVKIAISILSHKSSSVDLVGIQSRVEAFEKVLDIGSDEVRVVGICGMGGIGKTALASAVYYRIFHLFERRCFLANVGGIIKTEGLMAAQNQLISSILELKDEVIPNHDSFFFKRRLRRYRTLLVLDNVHYLCPLEKLVGKSEWYGAGSKVIVTTRDERILKSYGVDEIYRVELLNKDESLQLFCRSAFNSDYPLRDYKEISSSVLEYCDGLPLAIKSWGSFLFNRSVYEWRSALAKPFKVPDNSILNVLKLSYDELDDMEKDMFLDIACFFVGEKINYVKKILSHCGFYMEIGIMNLMDKSLMTISNQRIHMHYMLQEMGREIVWRESLKPGERSRMWLLDDFRDVMHTDSATKHVEAIVLNQDDIEGAPLSAKAFRKMENLRLLIIRNVIFSGSLEFLSNQLTYLSWHKYPFTCLPSDFEPNILVELIMPESSITHLWEGLKKLPKLRNINLRGSKNLIKTPDLSEILNLETLDLQACTGLLQLHPSIANLPKLEFLNLKNCTSLVSIPNNLFGMASLETLNLDGCSIQVKVLSNQHWPFLAKMLCYYFISFLKGIKNNKWVLCCLICLIYSIFSVCNEHRWDVS